MIANVAYAFLIATGFVSWGIIGKYTQAGSCWTAIGVNIATTFVLFGIYANRVFSGLPNQKAMILLAFAGIINGLAVWLYSNRVTDPALSEVGVAAFITTVWVTMIMMTPVINLVINHVLPTFNHAIGFAFAIAAVYFLSK